MYKVKIFYNEHEKNFSSFEYQINEWLKNKEPTCVKDICQTFDQKNECMVISIFYEDKK